MDKLQIQKKVIEDLLKHLSSSSLEEFKPKAKVTVMGDSTEAVEEGLEKAEDLLPMKKEESEEDDMENEELLRKLYESLS